MADSDLEEDEGEVLEIEEPEDDVIETDDGGEIHKVDPDDPSVDEVDDFYLNLAEKIPQEELSPIAQELITRIDYDRRARKKRDEQYEEGIRRTGLGDDAPGGAAFPGSSKTVHPMLAKGCVDFASRAIAEIFPQSGPVKDFIPGEPTKSRVEKARRKVAYMNWQMKIQMPEFRSELEQLLTQLPLGGSQYLHLVWDGKRKRPIPTFWPVDDVILPYAASNFYTAERITMVEHITEFEFKKRIREGLYLDLPELISAPVTTPPLTKSEQATDKVEGKERDVYNEDGLRDIYRVFTYLEIESDADLGAFTQKDAKEALTGTTDPAKRMLPYTVEICAFSHKILSIIRNWEIDDETTQPMDWLIEFPFIPWRGALSVGLGQLIGSLAASATGAIRALLDSAHVNNLPTLLKLKGANFSGQSLQLNATQVTEIEGGISGDPDIRKLIMAIPFNPPSLVLLQLVGLLTQEAEGVVRTTFEKLADTNAANMPVGTTLALIEQGMKVLSAIHLRLYAAMDRVLTVLHRINRMYVTDDEIKDSTGELLAYRRDFQGPIDVVPVADPEVFSDVQRFAQVQMVAQRAEALPGLYDQRKVEELLLSRTKIPNAKDLLLPAPVPEEMNPVNANAALALGRPVAAFPEQDHLAHIQVLLDFATSPVLGMSPIIAPTYLPGALNLLKEHIVLWYVNAMVEGLEQSSGQDTEELMKHRDPETRKELARTLAAESPDIVELAARTFEKLPPIIAQIQQVVEQYAQMQAPMPPDPRMAIAQIKAQTDAAKLQTHAQIEGAKLKQKAQDTRVGEQGDMAREQLKQTSEDRRTAAEIEARRAMNREDNITAATIAHAEIESGERVGVSTGTGINPKP